MKIMKRKIICFLAFLLSAMLTGCGKGGETSEGGLQECRNLKVETTYLPRFNTSSDTMGSSMFCLGTQFLGEEPIQLWAGYGSGSIYRWSMDRKKELVAKGIPGEFTKGGYDWYLDQDGCFYLIETSDSNRVIKLDSQGKELFRFAPDAFASWRVEEIRQSPDKKVYCVISEFGREDRLAELDPETGDITILEQVNIRTEGVFVQNADLGTGIDGPAVYRESVDIREVDTERGDMTEVLSLGGLSYSTIRTGGDKIYELADFRISEDGCAQMLLAASDGTAYVEHLSVEALQRIPIVIYSPGGWVRDQIDRFNQENDTYYIVVDGAFAGPITVGGAMYEEAVKAEEDYATRLSIELATGKGPDILVGERVLGGNVMDMIEKGVLEDLRPYMERSGIREEDYFPMVFDAWRQGDGIYGICPESYLTAVEADREIVGENPDIRGTTEALLAFQGDMVYMEREDSRGVLRLLLEGSETLGGMVDWEAGTFDFDREFFYDLLEVARRYGDTPTNNEPRIALEVWYDTFYRTTSPSELEKLGVALSGWMFDDGCYAIENQSPIAINANSPNKEAAWEFLCLLLGEEAQKEQRLSGYPVKRDMFDAWAEKQMDRYFGDYTNRKNRITGEYEDLWMYDLSGEDGDFIRNEKLPYFKKMLEEARHLPLRPVPLLDIICEESEDYFNGSKSAEEVADIVENRIELYLNERR